jgi:hypothetical protein
VKPRSPILVDDGFCAVLRYQLSDGDVLYKSMPIIGVRGMW